MFNHTTSFQHYCMLLVVNIYSYIRYSSTNDSTYDSCSSSNTFKRLKLCLKRLKIPVPGGMQGQKAPADGARPPAQGRRADPDAGRCRIRGDSCAAHPDALADERAAGALPDRRSEILDVSSA